VSTAPWRPPTPLGIGCANTNTHTNVIVIVIKKPTATSSPPTPLTPPETTGATNRKTPADGQGNL